VCLIGVGDSVSYRQMADELGMTVCRQQK